MLTGAALCPATPLLHPAVTGRAAVVPELRAACARAVFQWAAESSAARSRSWVACRAWLSVLCSKACIWSVWPVTVSSEPTSASCARVAADPDDPDGAAGQVAAAAVAAVATVNAPAAIRATALDRLH